MTRTLFLTLWLPAAGLGVASEEWIVGNSVFGQHSYIEYIPGDLPLVIAVPHGGHEEPVMMPRRVDGVTDSDANTQELARTIAAVVHAQTGRHAHLIISRLHRNRLDPNREITEAAQGNPAAEQAWREHHGFIEQACADAVRLHGVAFLIDLHGHGHKDLRVELGYLHSALDLADCTEALNEPSYAKSGSLGLIMTRSELSYVELLHGPLSLGAMLENEGFLATPSPRLPVPNEPFFRGGYTIARHCDPAQRVTGVQIEANRPRLRDTPANRLAFAHALVRALDPYLITHLGIGIDGRRLSETRAPTPPDSAPQQPTPQPAQ